MYPGVLASGFLVLPSATYQLAKNDLWLTLLPGLLVALIAVYTATRLHELYPKQTIVQYGERIVGKIPGKLLAIVYITYNLHAAGGVTRQYAEFIVGNFLTKTPIALIMASMLLLCAVAVYRGAELLVRGAVIFFPLIVVPILFLLFLIPDLDFQNIFPILSHGITPVAKGALPMMGWCDEMFMMSFFLPCVTDPEKARKYGVLTAIGVAVFLTFANLIALLLLGEDLGNKIYPLLMAFRYINIGHFLENLEALVLAMWVIGHFLQVGVFLYGAVLSFAHCFQLSDYRPIVFPIGLLCLAIGFWGVPNYSSFTAMVRSAVPFHIMSVYLVIPLLLLAVALIRKRKNPGGSPP